MVRIVYRGVDVMLVNRGTEVRTMELASIRVGDVIFDDENFETWKVLKIDETHSPVRAEVKAMSMKEFMDMVNEAMMMGRLH